MQISSMVIYLQIFGQPVFGWSDRSGENQDKETAGSKSRPAEDFVFSLNASYSTPLTSGISSLAVTVRISSRIRTSSGEKRSMIRFITRSTYWSLML